MLLPTEAAEHDAARLCGIGEGIFRLGRPEEPAPRVRREASSGA
ncbi:hypothetical protein [Siccirubricoccus deserti]|nr:hypothetical protein [Siccirubricoccus deserti]